MKLSVNKVLSTMRRRPDPGPSQDEEAEATGDSPEATASRCVRQFCESDGLKNAGDDVTLLPPIVDAAESSPAAAAECARLTKKYMHRDHWTKPSYQYNALMLVRILADNPGPTFTRNFDKKYVDAVKDLLKGGKDPSVRQLLMETLDSFEMSKAYDEGLGLIIEMWKKEKGKAYRAYGGRPPPGVRTLHAPPHESQNYYAQPPSSIRLPDAVELTNRLEEARTSAKLLEQVVACTPPAEVLSNELIREFSDRCLSASRSISNYMTAVDPAPDNDTMESLLDTNEQLQQALNHHQRAVLSAKKALGLNERSNTSSPVPSMTRPAREEARPLSNPPPVPARKGVAKGKAPDNGKGKKTDNGKGKETEEEAWNNLSAESWSVNGNSGNHDSQDSQDPFRDPQLEASASRRLAGGGSSRAQEDASEPRLDIEPFHPGFGGQSMADNGKARVAPAPTSDHEDVYNATPTKAGASSTVETRKS